MEEQKIARFIIEYDPVKNVCRTVIDGEFPIVNLVNMLELEKLKLLMKQLNAMAQAAVQQPRILDLNGAPLPNLRGT